MDLTSLVHEGTFTKLHLSVLILRWFELLGRYIWSDTKKVLQSTSEFPLCVAGDCSIGCYMTGTPGTDVCCCIDQASEL